MKNQRFATIVLALVLAASVAACKKKDGGGAGGSLGVPECDDYLARMDACAKKVGNKGGEGLTKMAAMMSKAWKEEVKNPESKKAMPKACTTAIKDMQKQLPECDWGIAAAPAEGSAAAPPAEGSAGSAAAPAEGSAAAGSAAGSAGSATP